MKKLIFCFFLICTGLVTSCLDKNEEVDESSKPSWLGSSIYDELSNPSTGGLSGTFSTYLRLIDDLGYAETLSRTGSKTIFPANDEAFEEFFSSDNDFGVSSYEELSDAQKKSLLYSSMLDNALLTGMLSNVNDGSSISRGYAVKHATNLSVIDTVAHVLNPTELYPNNSYWTRFRNTGLYTVSDGTTPMMVHFTRSYMLTNDITTTGSGSDFSILMGEDYDGSSTYIFRNKVIAADVTCQNGYIHQVENVLTPPGNMAQLLKKDSETTLFSRMLDRFAVPYYSSSVTTDYQDWAVQNGYSAPDSIFEVRYLSENSQGSTFDNDGTVASENLLPYDPGWNGYYQANNYNSDIDASIMTIGAMFVPTDDALKEYFLTGSGVAIIEENAVVPNTEENLEQNIDSIPLNMVEPIIANLMKESFASTVPSKFASITNDVSDLMGMSLDYVKVASDGSYDIQIANNGVIYKLNQMMAPVVYDAVSGPVRIKSNLSMMRWAVTNSSTGSDPVQLNLDFYAYLQAMSAEFAFFIPNDAAFDLYYIDPASLGRANGNVPEAIHYYYNGDVYPYIYVSRWEYDTETNTVGDSIGTINPLTETSRVVAQWTDILNFHTVVLNSNDNSVGDLTSNKYYKTKHGGEIMVTGKGEEGTQVMSGAQIDNGYAASTIVNVYNQENGNAYEIDRIIQGPVESVYKVLTSYSQFSEFLELCEGFSNTDVMEWAGIEIEPNESTYITELDQYLVFDAEDSYCLDYNISFFNTYNYTVYVPNNDAMDIAYENGLPSWDAIYNLYQYHNSSTSSQATAKEYIGILRDFVRYHFQQSSIYVDNVVSSGNYSTFLTDDLGISEKLTVSGGDGVLNVVDNANVTHTISDSGSRVVNRMTRDMLLDNVLTSATYLTTSSFAVVHELTEPLYYSSDKSFSQSFSDISSAKTHKSKTKR